MAYVNRAKTLLNAVQALLRGEFGASVPVYFGAPDTERAAHWFEVQLLRSEAIEDAAAFSVRRFTIHVAYLVRGGAGGTGHKTLGESYETAARMEGLLERNQVNDGEWIDGRVGDIDYRYTPTERDDDSLSGVLIEWAVTTTEILS